MKKILGIIFLTLLFYNTAQALPKCEGKNISKWIMPCKGSFDYPNSKYVGEFKDSKRHGQGTYTFSDGEKYIGEFKDGNFVK